MRIPYVLNTEYELPAKYNSLIVNLINLVYAYEAPSAFGRQNEMYKAWGFHGLKCKVSESRICNTLLNN